MDHDENLPPSRQREILQQRKIAKPLMEKRRRERINNCLEQLKSLLTEVTKKLDDDEEENSYRSKLEKADILEMTVNYLKSVKRQKMTTDAISSSTSSADPASSSSSSVHSRYVAGFRECAQQVAKYLEKADGLSATTRSTIIQHLTRRLHHQHHQHQQQQHHQQHQHQQHHHQQTISTSTIHPKHNNYLSGTTSSTASSSSSSSSPRLMMISSPASTAPPPPPPPAAVGFVIQTPPSFSSVSESMHSSSTSVVPSHHPIQLLPVQLATGETVFVLANANDLIPLRQQIHILTEETMTTTTGGTKQTNEATMQQPMDTAENNSIVIYEAISPAVVSPLQISQQNNHIDHPNPPLSYPCSTSSSTSSSADVYGKLQMMNYPPPHPPLVKSDQSGTQWNSLFKSATAASEFDPLESKCPPSAGDCRALLSGDCFSSSSVVDGRPILLPLPQIDTNAMAASDTCHQMNDDPCQVWRPW